MTPVSLDVFLPEVLPYVPHCPDPHAIAAIRKACVDLCRESQVLQVPIAVDVVGGTGTYTLSAPAGSTPSQVVELYFSGRRLHPYSRLELEQRNPFDWRSMAGSSTAYTQLTVDSFTLVPCPQDDAAGAITGLLAVVPSRSADTVDGVLFEQHVDIVAAGALARLQGTPEQPYSNPKAALANEARFRSEVSRLRARVQAGMSSAPMRVQLRKIF